jgi:hypothetical protein
MRRNASTIPPTLFSVAFFGAIFVTMVRFG